jgi:hypothetical protein
MVESNIDPGVTQRTVDVVAVRSALLNRPKDGGLNVSPRQLSPGSDIVALAMKLGPRPDGIVQSCFGSMYRYTMRPQFGHGPEIHRASAFHAWLQYGQSTITSGSAADDSINRASYLESGEICALENGPLGRLAEAFYRGGP